MDAPDDNQPRTYRMISNFDDLLQAARSQPTAQRLLLVFAGAELPDDADDEQRALYAAGQGGALVPMMCVDKTAEELSSFSALADEAYQFGKPWAMVFAAALSGQGLQPPSSEEAAPLLQRMVEAIQRGDIAAYIPFNPQGKAVQLG